MSTLLARIRKTISGPTASPPSPTVEKSRATGPCSTKTPPPVAPKTTSVATNKPKEPIIVRNAKSPTPTSPPVSPVKKSNPSSSPTKTGAPPLSPTKTANPPGISAKTAAAPVSPTKNPAVINHAPKTNSLSAQKSPPIKSMSTLASVKTTSDTVTRSNDNAKQTFVTSTVSSVSKPSTFASRPNAAVIASKPNAVTSKSSALNANSTPINVKSSAAVFSRTTPSAVSKGQNTVPTKLVAARETTSANQSNTKSAHFPTDRGALSSFTSASSKQEVAKVTNSPTVGSAQSIIAETAVQDGTTVDNEPVLSNKLTAQVNGLSVDHYSPPVINKPVGQKSPINSRSANEPTSNNIPYTNHSSSPVNDFLPNQSSNAYSSRTSNYSPLNYNQNHSIGNYSSNESSPLSNRTSPLSTRISPVENQTYAVSNGISPVASRTTPAANRTSPVENPISPVAINSSNQVSPGSNQQPDYIISQSRHDEDSSSVAYRGDAPLYQMSVKAINTVASISEKQMYTNGGDQISRFTPSRMMVQEIDEGQPCLACKDACPGFRSHFWRKICTHCKCSRESHDIRQRISSNVLDRIGLKATATSAPKMHVAKDLSMCSGFSWIPPGLQTNKIEEYMSQLPNHKVPRLHTAGEKYRNKQLVVQLPRQDLASAYCKHLSTIAETKGFEDFVNTRNEMALDIGYVNALLEKSMECRKCKGILARNELAVMAPKFGTNVCWHPACFVCSCCDELLVDLTYCIKDGKIFCERHYAESTKPRCAACDELIFAGEYTKAMNQDWHSGHFCCWQCDQTLTGQRYILRDDHPYCIKCYEEVFANSCDECAKPIGIDSKDLSYKEKHWHEHCFLCSMCKVSLVDKPFGSKNDRIFCASCYDQAFATRCDGCGEIFKAGMKKMEYKGKQWHDKCFCCALCKSPIGTKSFIPKNDEVYCATCYEEKFATRCSKCKKVIASGGVTYKNEPWHKECFCCCHCGTSLAGQRFTSKDEKPYCANCFGELFAKRCTACTNPITGIGGSKFISFEDRHWHNDCFMCAQCQTSLVGKGFITDSADILCPECAKARLMAQHA